MIRFFVLLSIVISFATKSNAQATLSKNVASAEYIKETLAFLNIVKSKELTDPTFTLVDVPKYSCFLYTVDDSVSFNDEELAHIVNEIDFPKITSWKRVLPASIRFLDGQFVTANSKVIKSPKREAKFFQKKFGGCYNNFSAPIFLRNYTFCLFYIDRICAGGQSKGELQVFEKRDGIWKQLTSRCEWTE